MNNKVYYPIPYLDRYSITVKGDIIDNRNNQTIIPEFINNDMMVLLDSGYYSLARLVLYTFVGPLPGEIVFKDNNRKNCVNKNIEYLLNVEYSKDMRSIIINGQLFKLAAHYDSRYYISEYGVVYDMNYGKLKRHGFSTRNYLSIDMAIGDDNKSKRMVHRWTYETWKGNIPHEYEVDHKDGKHWNGHIDNLDAVSPFENIQRSYDVTKVKTRKWTKDQIDIICKSIEENKSISQIRDILGMDPKEHRKLSELVHNIITKGYHRDISCNYDLSKYNAVDTKESCRTLSLDQVRDIVNMHNDGIGNVKIARKYNVPNGTIYNIIKGNSYKDFVAIIKSESNI